MGHRHEIRVRYGETDKMGVVHHSVYPLYLEEARTELMRSVGVPYADLEESGWLLPLTDLSLTFLRGPGYDEVIEIEARLVRADRIRLTLEYLLRRRSDGEPVARAMTSHVATSPELRPRRLPRDVLSLLSKVLEPGFAEDGGAGSRQSGPEV